MYVKKTYAYKAGKQVCHNGHIKAETAIKRGYEKVTLAILDMSGKGRGESRHYTGPNFAGMSGFF